MSASRSAQRAHEDIVRLAHSGLDSVVLRNKVAHRLMRAIPAASCGLVTVDPATLLLTGAVRINIAEGTVPLLARNEYAEQDFNKVAELVARGSPVGRLSAATGGKPELSERYRTIFEPLGWGDELRAPFISGGLCWGFACLHRDRSDPDFSHREAQFLASLAPHLGHGLREALLIAPPAGGCSDQSPGLIELADDLAVAAMNDCAERWLVELAASEERHMPLPPAVYSVVSRLRGIETDPSSAAPPRLRIRCRSGRWVVLHASTLSTIGGERRTIVIIEPARPIEITPIIVHAHGLSPRERQICLLALQGLSTVQISARLHLSINTIQDYLRGIFEKTGVRSRRELAGRIFSEHYWPLRGQPLGPDGKFAAWGCSDRSYLDEV